MLSSLPLQILFYTNGWYDVLFTLLMLVIFIWKGTWLPYGEALWGLYALEIIVLFLLGVLEYARLFLGSKGNKTERAAPLIWGLVLCIPSLVAFVYYMRLQIYVTRADVVLSAIGITYISLEVLLGLLTIATFVKAPAQRMT
uniref:Transmembrane protein 216 n=1 Tax=Chrysotila carterae TaxID=13221 RepID=A0A7S4C6A8_CHRCT|mmetsp:Transcript_47228/g.102557  ORF Transcript_47228/g.102557 Transcript_47228/m.102557 type:complete len:142 (-) Transcript_47228:328-753(-)